MSSSIPNKVISLPKQSMSDRKRGPGLKITSIKTIKQPDPALVKRQEEDNLRAELHKEIKWRSRACSHQGYECTLPVVCGREYCARHILEDTTAPYKQCLHTYSNSERCPLPAPAPQSTVLDNRKDQGLCFEHARAAMSTRQRSGAPPPPVTTVETLLYQLQHYVRPERARTTSCASAVSVVSDPDDGPAPHPLDPFKQIDAVAVNTSSSATLMECASGSDSDADSVTLGRGGSCRGGADEDLSGDEEAPYDTHPLRYAGVFTAEEAVWSARTALRQLQAGYVRQLGRLTHLLRIERAKYLKQLKIEREHYCNINTQARSGGLTARERKQLRKLKAYASYHTRRGVCAVLARKLHRKRARAAEPKDRANNRIAAIGRCTFAEGGVRCETRSLPAARHCLKHIMHDNQQVLFATCGDRRVGGGGTCREPVARLPLPTRLCRYHTDPPHYTAITLKKGGDSESETTESGSEQDSESEFQQQSDWQST